MYLWKTEKLIADFQENKVSEKEKLKYVIFAVAVCSLLTNPIVAMSEKYSHLGLVHLVLIILMNVYGTLYTFRKNSKGDNIHFVTRYICLIVPIGIKMFFLAIFLYTLSYFIDASILGNVFVGSEGEALPTTTVTMILCTVTIAFLYYYFLGKAIGEVAGNNNKPNQSLENSK